MTSASARRFGLKDKGELAAGKAADLVVFDPETVSDTPPQGKAPAGRPVGIKQVFINGKRSWMTELIPAVGRERSFVFKTTCNSCQLCKINGILLS